MAVERDNPSRQDGEPAVARTQISPGSPSTPGGPEASAPAGSKPPGEEGSRSRTAAASSLIAPSFQQGSLLADRFEVIERAAAGGMADVYRAIDRSTGQIVALKLLRDASSSLQRFEREATLLAETRHPGMARYIAHGTLESGSPFLAMEWLDGCPLEEFLGQQLLSVRQAVELVQRVAQALEVLHAQGIVHRDLNPSNLFLVGRRVDDVRILDFGIARIGSATLQLTSAGDRVGTPGYMAPEQAQGQSDIGCAADVFSLGCVLYECLTGKKAFAGGTLLEVLAKILADQVPRPSATRPDVPPRLDDLVAAMLSKAPSDRPGSAGVVALALSQLGELSERAPESQAPSSAAVTASEQRIACVILARTKSEDDYGRACAAARLHGVRPSRLADGTLVALVSGQGSATDQVAQAARCALALQEATGALQVALATGLALTTGAGPSGQAIESASDALLGLEAAGAPESRRRGSVWIDETTATLLDSRFDVRSTDRGFVLRGTRQTLEPTRTVLGRHTRCVGRKRELGLLAATFEECREEGVANIVLVTGPPGIGKSRLAHEFIRRLRRSTADLEVLWGNGDPMSVGSPFSILIRAIQQACRIADGEPLPARRHKLQQRLARVVAAPELSRVTEFLGELIGTPFEEESSPQLRAARQDAVLRGDQILRSFEDWLAAECAQHPTVLLLDDFQWGDLPTVKFIDSVLRNLGETPLMVVALARPEIHESFPRLWNQRGVSELRLSGLTRRACQELVQEVLGSEIAPSIAQRVIERAQGNPFWLEELLRAEAAGAGDTVPDRILLLAQSRLEQLDSDARRVLRAASIFGQRFWTGGVLELLGPEGLTRSFDAVLRSLLEEELVSERSVSRFPGERELEFRSGLVRDAAYATLTEEDCCYAHRLAAAWLTNAGESEALRLATHYARGGQNDRAVSHYRRAAHEALSGNDLDAAIERAALGLGAGPAGAEAAALRLIQAEASKWQGNNAAAKCYALDALVLASEGSPDWCVAAAEAAVAAGKLGDREECLRISRQLLEVPAEEDNERELTVASSRVATQLVLSGEAELASELLARATRVSDELHPDPGVLGWLLEARAVLAGATDDPVGRMDLAEAAANRFEEAGDLRNASLQRVSLGFAQVEFGAYADAERWLREALAIAERMALSNTVPIAEAQLGRALARQGRVEETLELEARAIAAFDRQGNLRLAGMARVYLAQEQLALGQLEAARSTAQRAVEVLASAPPLQRSAHAVLSRILAAQGHLEQSLEAALEANDGLDSDPQVPVGECLIRLALVEALRANQRHAEALETAQRARDRVDALSRGILNVERRRQYLQDTPERRRILELAAG